MNTIAPHALPSIVTIGASIDILWHHEDDNHKDDSDSDSDSDEDSSTVSSFFSDDDSESCASESSESTYNSSTSYVIELSRSCDLQPVKLTGEVTSSKELRRTKPRPSVQRRINLQNLGVEYEDSDEDSVVLLRRRDRDLQDSCHSSWSDKILEKMDGVDLVIVPLKDDLEANDYTTTTRKSTTGRITISSAICNE